MPPSAPERIARETSRPRIVQLWWALQPLRTVVSFMNSGAHPDDETSAMLAALALRDGVALSFACANRGEGGQNDIGAEAGADLGVLRTAEMERAAERLNMRLYWLSQSPDDPVFDFGFSKRGTETLAKWGRDRTLSRMVDILRRERPDVLCPTFLDIPGQHGHHRAMTEIARLAFDAAADPSFVGSDLPLWQVRKFYLPAWSGAGRSYDDDLPPPPTSIVIDGQGCDAVTGWSWERIAQQSRVFHRTQGMGSWVPAGEERDFPLHLAASHVPAPEQSLFSGLLRTVGDLADIPAAYPIAHHLLAAQSEIERAISSFPDDARLVRHAAGALAAVQEALEACPRAARDEIAHRLDRKVVQLSRVLRIASGVEVFGVLSDDWLRPGQVATLEIEKRNGHATSVDVSPELPGSWSADGAVLSLSEDAAPTDPYPDCYDPDAPRMPSLSVRMETHGVASETRLPLEREPVVLPARTASLAPARAVLNIAQPGRKLSIVLSDCFPAATTPTLQLPESWQAVQTATGFDITLPENIPQGLYEVPLWLDGQPAHAVRRIEQTHVGPLARSHAARVLVRVLDVAVSSARIGYVGSGNDRVAHWLSAIGADVVELTDADLANTSVLENLDSIVLGIFTLRFRPSVADAMPRLHEWVRQGGNLVTLYHRPWDNWQPEVTPPLPLTIGQPSLRWRVTDENAEVSHLVPDHPLLTFPNRIGAADWDGWHKERGLYFASDWDDGFAALLEMADPDEQPHKGALLCAPVGRGRYSHCALILHHQMENLVPGGFRLMANLVAPPN